MAVRMPDSESPLRVRLQQEYSAPEVRLIDKYSGQQDHAQSKQQGPRVARTRVT